MRLNKVKIGTFVELHNEACNIPNLTVDDVSGVNREKEFFEPSKQVGSNTSKYKVVPPNYFACNLMHVGRDVVLPIAINQTKSVKYVSPAYTVFKIINEQKILKEFFYIMLKSTERDRFFWFHTDSSIRDGMKWDVFCDVEIRIPDVVVQQKYVDVYLSIQENIDAMTCGIDQLQQVFNAYMQKLLITEPKAKIATYIEQTDIRNSDLASGIDDVRGISIEKKFINTKANMARVSLRPYKVVAPQEFCYVTVTSRNGDKVSIALNDSDDTYIVSSSYVPYKVINTDLIPEYLFMFLRTSNFDRYARFNSWGTARETFAFEDLGQYKIPVPSRVIQQDIISIFSLYNTRRKLVDKLTDLQKKICPILIMGATEEGGY